MLKPKKIPMRMCVACHEMKPKKELQRIVRSPEGEVSIDQVGKEPGRGAYLCASVECLRKARKQKAHAKRVADTAARIADRLKKGKTVNKKHRPKTVKTIQQIVQQALR